MRLATLISVRRGTRNGRPHFSRLAAKCVDFVLCDPTDLSPRLVVELDDASHNRPDRRARDAFVDAALAAAGLPILHVRWQRRYELGRLAAEIRAAAGLALAQGSYHSETPPATLLLPAPPPVFTELPAAAPPALSPPLPLPVRWACRSCGAAVGATAQFCTGCGAQLEMQG